MQVADQPRRYQWIWGGPVASDTAMKPSEGDFVSGEKRRVVGAGGAEYQARWESARKSGAVHRSRHCDLSV